MQARLVATDARNPAPSTVATRAVMRANRGRDTGPELELRRRLRAGGIFGYRLNRRIGPVRPDIVFGPSRVAVFVHGCYWHRCPICRHPLPRTNRSFWRAKFVANRQRDRRVSGVLRRLGWTIVVIWAHELDGPSSAVKKVAGAIARYSPAID